MRKLWYMFWSLPLFLVICVIEALTWVASFGKLNGIDYMLMTYINLGWVDVEEVELEDE